MVTPAAFGVTDSETSVGELTLKEAEADTDSNAAVSVAVPWPVPGAKPVMLTVAIPLGEEDHATKLVTSCALPSLYVPITWYCWVAPSGIAVVAGLTATDTRAGGA